MVKLVYLAPHQGMPADGDRILVKRNSSGTFDITRWSGRNIAYEKELSPLEQAIDHAERDAAAFGIATIHLEGCADAQGS